MLAVKKNLTAVGQSLFTLGSFLSPICNEVLIQAPLTNVDSVYFGEEANEVGFLISGGSANLVESSLKNIYVKGTPTDEIIILVL